MNLKTNKECRVEPLKKVQVRCKGGTVPGGNDLVSGDERFDFIFGLGAEGLSPFEFKLDGKSVGEEIDFAVPSKHLCQTFQNLTIPGLSGAAESGADVYFTFTIEGVSTPDSREIIKAMAELSACGGGACECCGH